MKTRLGNLSWDFTNKVGHLIFVLLIVKVLVVLEKSWSLYRSVHFLLQ